MIKKIISKITDLKIEAGQKPFWKWIERERKIRSCSDRLKAMPSPYSPSFNNYKELLTIAQDQQKLLENK